jgi:hypothetical protein
MTLPSFICIGAQKSGTTWIDSALRLNPAVYLPAQRKEVHFFDRYFDQGVAWYEAFFRDAGGRICGEVTPAYLFDPAVPQRIRGVCPEAKLVVSLRDPVRRAYSHYRQLVAKAGEHRSFMDVIDAVPEVFARGLYHQQLSRYLEYFPREQMYILIFEDIVAHPQTVYDGLCNFLDIPVTAERERLPSAANESSAYAQSAVARLVNQGAVYLRRMRLDSIIDVARPWLVPLVTIQKQRKIPSGPSTDDIVALRDRYSDDVKALDSEFAQGAARVWQFVN